MVAHDPAAERPGDDAEHQRERADRAGRAFVEPTVAVEQGDDPVARRHAQPERGPVERGQTVQPPVAEDTGSEPVLSRGPRTPLVARRGGEQRQPDQCNDDGARVGSTPADPALHLRHDGECEAAAREPDASVQALRGRRASDRSHVGAAGDEPEPGADAGKRAHRECQSGDGRSHRCGREHGDQRESEQPGAARTEAVARPAARDLHRQMGDEECGREQSDCRQPDAVAIGELLGDRARVGDVPARRQAERAGAEDPPSHPRA